jgi:hypothetical protein
MTKWILVWMAFLLSLFASASAQQQGLVTGIVLDTLTKTPVYGATLTILKKSDSSLVSFTMSGQDGKFRFTQIPSGDYRLLVTHVNYHNTNLPFMLTAGYPSVDFSTVPMGDRYKTLSEVVINAEAAPITVKMDTVEYNAGSFKTEPNANVEDLLRKLPGVRVEKDGSVKAQGQKVNRVFVDGKEFFGNDPKIATRNLPADAVDKVQVYDRMSEQSQLTGFDDGNSEKAINLKLKKDKKKGLFGKVSAGIGTQDRYEGRFNVNSFKGARQLSVIGMGNNTNAEGFSFMDILNFSGEMSRLNQSGGNMSINISNDNPAAGLMGMGGNRNNGINTTWAGGVNYNDLIGTKLDLRSNYFYSRFNPEISTELDRQYILPDSSYYYQQQSNTDNIASTHRVNAILDYMIDSLHSIRIAPSLSIQDNNNRTESRYGTMDESMQKTNEGLNRYFNFNGGYNLRSDLLFRKKFRKRGRTFSFAYQHLRNAADGNGDQQSINRFYESSGTLIRLDSINQHSETMADLSGYTARAVYTEPVLRRSLLEFSAATSRSRNNSSKTTWDYNPVSEKFDLVNPLLTNDFENRYGYTNTGIRFRKQEKKYNWAVGVAWQQASLEGLTVGDGTDSLIRKDFRNILPNARFQYNFNRFSNLTFQYTAMTNQPTISQLQPLPDISNPLSIRLGNPDLKQEFINSFLFNLVNVNPFKNRNFFSFVMLRHVLNRIVNSDTINSLGIKATRPVNTNGIWNLNGDLNYGMPVKLIRKSTVNLSVDFGYNKNKEFVNGSENKINDFRIRPELRFELNPVEKINAGIYAATSWNRTSYSLQPEQSTKYFTTELGGDLGWELPGNFYFRTDFNYLINARRADGYNVNVPLWNATVSRQFLKYNRAQIGLRVFDILNQNVGITRTSNSNYIEDRRTTLLQRYFMLSFTYSLSKSGLNSGNSGNIRVISR